MNYLKIVNNGLIEVEDLTLVGSSTKRGIEGKIGEFGSGNKFSLAWYERNGCTPKIFRGQEDLDVSHSIVLHRDNPVKVITVGGQQTSITSTMGPKWSGWMALRETISNAIDEGGISITTVMNPEEFNGQDDKTTYFIPMNEELSKVMMQYDKYFSMDRVVSERNELGEMFYKTNSDDFTLYRQGIRCWENSKEFPFDMNLFDISINESRLTSENNFDNAMRKFILAGITIEGMRRVLSTKYYDMLPSKFSQANLNVIEKMVEQGSTFGSATMEKLAGMLGTAGFDYVIPHKLIEQLHEVGILTNDESLKKDYIEVEDRRELAELKYHLGVFNLGDVFTLKSVVSDSFNILKIVDDTIYINVDAHSNYNNGRIIHSIFSSISSSKISELIR